MTTSMDITVPDIGGFTNVNVVDVLVKVGQNVDVDTPLITLETDKAAMDVPAPAAGVVRQLNLKRGDKVSQGSSILLLEVTGAVPAPAAAAVVAPVPAPAPAATSGALAAAAAPAPMPAATAPVLAGVVAIDEIGFSKAHASPSVRKFARELGVDLSRVPGTGPKGRITPDDVKAHVKKLLASPAATIAALPKVPEVDFTRFGPVEIKPLSRIQRISGARLQASWINLPHVTQHEDADITDLEALRAARKDQAAKEGVRLTPLAYIIRACALALRQFPRFNSSLDATGENLVVKQYCHIGFAVDTPDGLVVPVIRDADKSDVFALARALAQISEKARAGKLTAQDMQGGCFTVSSLGGIGGTAFTPIINAPEVAILGVARSAYKPVFTDGAFVPRLILPLSLSYDHRVIDGAEGARFVVHLAKLLANPQALS
jgi:pyruvate dehydrogenase E2 component (dihydrolipoamide acetyltransferase)